MSLLAGLRELDDQLTTDDAPWWAEVLGPVLAIGLVLRGGVHVWTALLASDVLGESIDPTVDKQDVTLASPVYALRGHRLEVAARFVSAGIGIGLWSMVEAADYRITAVYLALQLGVCIADPIALVLWKVTNRTHSHNMIPETDSTAQMDRQTTSRGDP